MGLSCGWCFLKKCKKPETNKLNGSLHSLQSFRDQISSDPRVDINTATKEQLQTLPGVTHVSVIIIDISNINLIYKGSGTCNCRTSNKDR